jgi:DinB family protein
MNVKDAIRSTLKSNLNMMSMTLADMSDQDLLVRPVPNANHIAWQLGHLIVGEHRMVAALGGTTPPLPAGFAEQHKKDMAAVDPPQGFATKEQYLDLLNKAREATLEAAAKLSEADLDKPVEGPMARIAPNLAALASFPAIHAYMHMGQFSVVRRKLGKPVLI